MLMTVKNGTFINFLDLRSRFQLLMITFSVFNTNRMPSLPQGIASQQDIGLLYLN